MQQLWNVLGPEGSKYVVWLTIAIGLVIAVLFVLWIASSVFGRGLNFSSGGRGQQPQRLGITGAFNVDRKGRKLVILRRDNVEHLVLIGGPNDVLIESNIIRAAERGGARAAATQPPMPEMPLAPAILPPAPPPPVQPVAAPPLPAVAPAPAAPPRAATATVPPQMPIAPPPSANPPPPLPPSMAKAAVAQPPVQPASRPPQPAPAPVEPPRVAPPATQPVRPVAPPQQPPQPASPAVRAPVAPAPSPAPAPARPSPPPVTATPTQAAPAVQRQPVRDVPSAVEQPQTGQPPENRLSDMAKRLQSVLKQPLTPVGARAPDPVAAAKAESIPIPLPSRAIDQRPAEPAAAQVTQGKTIPAAPAKPDTTAIDSLEEEMARLLGRSGPDKH